jgi:hypothetical protein
MPDNQWTCFEADQASGWDQDDFSDFVVGNTWVPARTMPSNPHEYTLRRDPSDSAFEAAVRFIRERGWMESYETRPYKVLHFRGYKYWTMGADLSDTVLINRKSLGVTPSGTVALHFHGPLTFTEGPRFLFHSPLADAPCVYLWTVKSDLDGLQYIHYVGESVSLARRHREHLVRILGLDYGIFDPEEARRGVQKLLWPGLWRDKGTDGPARQLEAYRTLTPTVLRYLECLSVFAAETHVDTQLRKHIEGSIGWNLRENHDPYAVLYPADNRIGRRAAKAGLTLLLSADEPIAGLDPRLEV